MILIVGARLDDIAYLAKKLSHSRVEKIVGKYEVTLGQMGKKDVAIAVTGFGNEMASMITALLIERYHPYLVFSVGTVYSISSELKQNTLFIADRIYAMDLDLLPLGKYRYGQIPEMPSFFSTESEIEKRVVRLNGRNKNVPVFTGVLLSSNRFYTEAKEMKEQVNQHFAKVSNVLAADTESAGVAAACHLFDVPHITLKSCSYEIGNEDQMITRVRSGIEMSLTIGQLLTSLFDELEEGL